MFFLEWVHIFFNRAEGESESGEPLLLDQPLSSWASNPSSDLTEEQRNILATRNASASYVASPDLMLLADAWSGHSSDHVGNYFAERNIFERTIPRHTTA